MTRYSGNFCLTQAKKYVRGTKLRVKMTGSELRRASEFGGELFVNYLAVVAF